GAESKDLVGQANDVVRRIREHPEIDMKNSWKLVHIFIGANDICIWCDYQELSADHFRDSIAAAVQVFKDNLP
ncbi:hypothetical protein PENTCL1PPCAC_9504, partial [Pristionchus entomophagus]